ncbi:MAG TPA: MaoC/PaaZ C-terminal domain-containing protein [Candidatus Hydrogenedentes bacterium]|nr:MAG: MaoC like domain protein [Candidatus Hydrogenedentes bacterium ADurb.Bin179]HOH28409.1 MaoC/PaaZ C-terminal domain-containing protein [Candidatus Hydrogenedentota bacterium]
MSTTLEFKGKPSLLGAYVNIFTPGRTKYAGIEKLPRTEAFWNGARETPEKIQSYREACGFGNDGKLPILYPHVFTSAMHIHALATKSFPLSALGAVHSRNHILQRRPISETEPVDLKCSFGEARVLKAGLEVDVVTRVLAAGECVWESISSYLFRGKHYGETGEPHPSGIFEELGKPTIEAQWHVPPDMGRRYARITGDYNPIHISRILAKAFGFKRDIIHGMWSLAKCLAHLQDLNYEQGLRLDVAFKGPVFMDSDSFMKGHEIAGGYRFDLYCGKNPRPSIVAAIRAGDKKVTLV